MFVSLLSGCASAVDPNRVPMATVDLNTFQVNCRIKDQQVAFLQSMRQSRDEQFAAQMRAMLRPITWTTDHDIAYGNPNKFIDYHLRNLSSCP